MSSPEIERSDAEFKKLNDEINSAAEAFMLTPRALLQTATSGQLNKTQLGYFRREMPCFWDPSVLTRDSEIAELANLDPILYREMEKELAEITNQHYVVLVIRELSPGRFPFLLENLPVQEELLVEKQTALQEKLQRENSVTDDTKMQYILLKLGRRLLADWAKTAEARDFMARWPQIKVEREEYIASFFGIDGVGPRNYHQQMVAMLMFRFFGTDTEEKWRKLPLVSPQTLQQSADYLEAMAVKLLSSKDKKS